MTTVLQEPMDITNVLNNRLGTMVHHPQHFPGHYTDAHHQLSFVKPEPTMERSASPHTSEHSSYSNPHAMQRSFHSPSAMQAPMQIPSSMPTNMHVPGFPEMPNMGGMPNMTMPPHMQQHHDPHQQQQQHHQQQPAKAYPCSACGKRFARRSDLSRHERIHSGVRPHVCDYPDCGKMFIQRSALTVHKRVHTGEKPHTCETCAKRFGDSSSLARHRRTHTGNRPYKCPYADCQKTFTRKTTLTRHQNHHSGTIEEAAAATAAALAASKAAQRVQQTRSEGDHLSSHGSPLTTPSPAQRTMSMSPAMDLSNNMNRHTPDFQYLQQGGTLPPHLRVGSPTSTTSSAYTNGMRPTSHPTGYGPPPTLEPSLEQHQSASGSASGSPHMSSVGWQSPNQVPSPSQPHAAGYVYPDPDTYPPSAAAMGQMYYGATPQMRRPQSTEPGMVHMT